MRNPNRIKSNWQKISELHEKFPDWRMSQFLINVFKELGNDPFYLEDEEFINIVEKIVEKWQKK